MFRFVSFVGMILFCLRPNFAAEHWNTQWNGYLQIRGTATQEGGGFSVRRTKLWVKGSHKSRPLSYKIQSLYQWNRTGYLVLQDAYAEYSLQSFALKAGQFVPGFSLERNQPDVILPLAERARVVDALIPGAQTLARDIGLQIAWRPAGFPVKNTIGIFNGHGANVRSKNDYDFLVTNRLVYDIGFGSINVHAGASLAYREIQDASFGKIFGANHPYSGTDFRNGCELMISGATWKLQGEYLQADFKNERSQGWYSFFQMSLRPKEVLAFSLEEFHDLNMMTLDERTYTCAFSHLFDGNNNKLMLNIHVIESEKSFDDYTIDLQYQLFFHS